MTRSWCNVPVCAGDKVRLEAEIEFSPEERSTFRKEAALPRVGDVGRVDYVDDEGVVHVNWDSGAEVGLLPKKDRYSLVYEGDD